MPNWCHNTLTASGPLEGVARFKRDARVSDEQPLSFARILPEPSEQEYAAMDEERKVACYLCAGRGKRPVTKEEADEWGCVFHPNVEAVLPFAERRPCNLCAGSGRALPSGQSDSWWNWRYENWGCKWDASFGEPFMALVAEGGNVEATTQALGVVETPEIAIYKFDTPWGPPVPFVERASELYPELEFVLRFGEPGGDFAGQVRCVAGITIESEDLPIDTVLAAEEMWY